MLDVALEVVMSWMLVNGMLLGGVPDIVILSPAAISKLYGTSVLGLYDMMEGVLYLSSDVDLSTYGGRSVLLHELVHHYQYEQGLMTDYDCLLEREKLAYEMQIRFLLDHGQGLTLQLDPMNVLMRTTCFPEGL